MPLIESLVEQCISNSSYLRRFSRSVAATPSRVANKIYELREKWSERHYMIHAIAVLGLQRERAYIQRRGKREVGRYDSSARGSVLMPRSVLRQRATTDKTPGAVKRAIRRNISIRGTIRDALGERAPKNTPRAHYSSSIVSCVGTARAVALP